MGERKAGEGVRTLDFHVGNLTRLRLWRYQKRGFALHIWSVLHYIKSLSTGTIELKSLPEGGSLCLPIRQVQPAKKRIPKLAYSDHRGIGWQVSCHGARKTGQSRARQNRPF